MPMCPRDVLDASRRLGTVAVRTPLLSSPAVDALLGRTVLLKMENVQRTGSFKFRGAYHAVARIAPHVRPRGVIGASSGNHAQALALAAHLFRVPATVVMPADAPAVKRAAAESAGARVITYDRRTGRREAIVAALADEQGLMVVPSANSRDIIAGAGTAAWEMIHEAPDLVAVVVAVGGGGLAAGTALAARAHHRPPLVIGVEPTVADDTRRSLRAGRLVAITPPVTIADGLCHTEPAVIPWEINQRFLHEVVTVSEDAIAEAMAWLWRHFRTVAEPSGSTALAGLIACHSQLPPGPVGVILSGGNVDWTAYRALVTAALDRSEHARATPPVVLR